MNAIKRILSLAGLFAVANSGIAVCHADTVPPVRIMPLGDSITRGWPDEGGYRNSLHTLLTNAGYNVDFVGTQTDAGNASLPDRDHQGMPTYQIDGIRASLGMWMKSVEDPDVILLHLGTNDFTAGASVADVQNRLKNLLADISSIRPHADIIVASLILRNDATEALQAQFAAALPQLVDEQVDLGRKVHLVDLHSALDSSDLADAVHPNAGGYADMASAWLPAIVSVISPEGTSRAPMIASVDARTDLEHLAVKFSKPVEDAAAAVANFNISGGVAVTGAALDSVSKRVVTLTTTPQAPGMLHTVTVSGVRDRTPQHHLIQPQSVKTFTSRSLIDGSFEFNGQGWTSSGNSTVSNSSVPATNGTSVVVFNGLQSAPNGVLSQTISTVPGEHYRLEFDMGIHDFGTHAQSLELTVEGDSLLLTRTESLTGTGSGTTRWVGKSVEFTADSGTTIISFRDVSTVTSDVDLLLDDVRLNAENTATLTVISAPSSGLSVTVSPLDNGGNSDGTTDFTRTYDEGSTVNLTAPASFGGMTFEKWQKDSVNFSTSPGTTVTMDADHTMTAVYKTLINGSFELGTPGNVGTLDGWTVTGTAGSPPGTLPFPPFGYLTDAPNYVPTEGNRLAVFNGASNTFDGVVSQSFATVAGQTYSLSLDLGITGLSGKKQRLLVGVSGGASLLSQVEEITATGLPALWAPRKNYTFVADSALTTVTFSDASSTVSPATDAQAADLLLDNVVVANAITRTLTINSTPASGVNVTVSPSDSGGNGNGATNFTRSYGDGSVVTLTAPVYAGSNIFQKWQKNAADLTTNLTATVTMDADHTLSAVYVANAAPVAAGESYSTVVDTPLTVSAPGVLANDTDAESASLTAIQVAAPAHGSLTLNANGGFTYTPATGYTGPDSFTYKANDGGLDSNVATVSLTVNSAAPNLVVNGSFEQGAVIVAGVTAIDTWTAGGAQFGYVGDAQYPASEGARLLVFNGGYNGGSDTFTGVVSQSFATVIGQAYKIELDVGIYSAGIAGKTQRLEVKADGAANLQTYQVPLVSVAGPNIVQWTPATVSFVADSTTTTLTLRDNGTGLSATSASDLVVDDVRVTATSGNSAPLAVADSYSTTADTQLIVPLGTGVLANDSDINSDTLTAVQVSGPAQGGLTLNANGSFTYTPASGYTGPDSFTYKANDGSLDSNVVTVSITVNAAAPAGLANGGFELGTPANVGTLQSWTVTGSAPFPPFGYLTDVPGGYVATEGTRMAVFNGGGSPADGVISQEFGTISGQTYTLSFDIGVSASVAGSTHQLQVSAVNTTPGGGNQSLLSQLVSVSATATGTSQWKNPRPSFTFVAQGTHTTLTFADATVGGNSGTGDLLLDNVSVEIPSSNTAPVASNDSYTTSENAALTISAPGVLGNDTDGEANPLTAIVVSNPTNGTVSLNTTGGFTYTPTSGFSGSDTFTYKANDGNLDSNVATVTITVNPAANSLVNGSFEQGTPANLGPLDGWTVTGSTGSPPFPPFGFLESLPSYDATDGVRMVAVNGASDVFDGALSQQFTTVPNQAYTLEFDFGIFASEAGPTQSLQVSVVDSTSGGSGATLVSGLQTLTATAANVSQWKNPRPTYTFVAQGNQSTLTFADASNMAAHNSDMLLDRVRIIPLNSARVLTINSTPVSGLAVSVSPADLGGRTNGSTNFARTYASNASVTVTATAASGPNVFQKWQKHGVDLTTDPSTTVTMDADHTLTAVYIVDNTPRGTADSYTPTEDLPFAIAGPGVLGNDVEPNALALSAVLETTTSHGTLQLNPDGSFLYTPEADFNGADSFTYRASNGTLASAPVTVSLTVQGSNDLPIAAAVSAETAEDTAVPVTLSASDIDAGDTLSYIIVTQPSNGVLSGTGANRTYTPAANFHGSDSFTFKANDGTGDSNVATVSINVTSVEDVPVANAQNVVMTAATSKAITLVGSDPDGSPVTYTVVSGPTQGILSGTVPNLTYTPLESYVGSDSFTFKVNDGTADSPVATVSITINSILTNGSFESVTGTSPNLIPTDWTITSSSALAAAYEIKGSPTPQDGARIAAFNTGGRAPNAIFSQTFATTPGRPYILRFSLGIHTFDTNSREQVMGVTLSGITSTPPANQTITRAGLATGTFAWEAKEIEFTAGAATTTLQLRDLSLTGASGAVDMLLDKVSVEAKNNTRQLTVESTPSTGVSVTVSPADINASASGSTNLTRRYNQGAVVSLTAPATAAAGTLNFQKWKKNGADHALTAATTVTMDASHTLTAVYIPNAAPVAGADSYSTNEDTVLQVSTGGVLGNDSDPESQPMTAVVVDEPDHGVLVLNSDGTFTYTPDDDYFGTDGFTYRANDGVVNSDPATVTITVSAVNDAPVANDDGTALLPALTIIEDSGASGPINVLGNDTDVESEPLSVTAASSPQGSVSINPDGTLVFTPSQDFAGDATISYAISDGNPGGTDSAFVFVKVTNVNDAPVANAGTTSVDEDGTVDIALTGSDADALDSLSYSIVAQPAHGTVTLVGAVATYVPSANYTGADSFTFTVNDGTVDSASATISITVNPVNDAPVANAQSVSVDEDGTLGITLSGSDVEGSSLTYTVGTPAHGTLSGTAPDLTYTPASNYTGADSFTFTVNDGTVDSASATISITVNPVNDAPVANAQTVSVDEDGTLPITLSGSDVEGSSLTYSVGTPAHGTLSGTAPDLTYTPALNYTGADSFTFTVNDGTVDSAAATISITVNPVNDAPVANAQSVSVDEDGTLPITLSGSDVEGSSLTYTVGTPAHGTLSGTAPDLTYTPASNYTGADSFTFTVNDGTVDSASATISITVNPVNDAPVANAQTVSVDEDGTLPITLSVSDVEGSSLTYTVGTPAHGTLSGTAPNLTYTPALNYTGADSFTFTVNDGTVDSAAATISITVNPVNDAPVANAQSVSVDEDGTLPITLSGSDVEGSSLTYTVGTPAHGTLSGTAPDLTYTPASNYTGADSFTFTVNDGTVDSASATISITVNPVNDAPVANAQTVSVDEDGTLPITLSGSDVEGSSLTYTVGAPAHGTLSGTVPDLTYTPELNYTGADSFTFTVNDGTVDSASATISITVNPVNDAPVANAHSVSVDEDGTLGITLSGSDVEGSSLTYTVGTPAHGTLSGTAPDLTYTPASNYTGADSFTFTVNDGTVDSASATISITVNPVNDTPIANAQTLSVNEDGTLPITLSGSDLEGSSLTYSVGTPAHGTLSGTAPDLTYTPALNYTGADSFTFTVNDGTVDSASATISITVNPLNDAPVANAQTVSVDEDGTLPITLSGSDVEGSSLTYTVGAPAHGTLSGTAPDLTYTPASNYTGADSFTFRVNDGTVDSASATISITVNPVNDAPVANAQSVSVNEDGSMAITLSGSDMEGPSLTYAVGTPGHGTLSGTAPALTYTPASNFSGPDSFTFTVNDGTVDSAAATIAITVNPVNDTPIANAQTLSVNEDGTLPISLSGSDVETSSLTYSVGTPAHGTLSGTVPNLTYTPALNYTGADSFTFTVNDGTVDSAAATISITVNPVNDTPVANAQSVSVDEDGTLPITLSGSDVEGSSLTYTVGTPAHGTLSGTVPNLTYTPALNYTGADSFTFTVNDGTVDSAAATISITVNPVNDTPVANAQSVSVNENASIAVMLSGSDVEGSSLTYTVGTPSHGTLSGTAPNVTYAPAPNYSGPDSFTFTVNDGTATSAPATVTITVNDVTPEFTAWMAEYGLTAGPNADSDGDSVSNAVEFVIGGNPANQNNVNLLPTTTLVTADPDGNTISSNYVLFTYRRTDRAKNDPLTTIKSEWNDDFIGPWTNAAGSPGVVILEENDGFGAGVDRVKVYLPRTLTPNGRFFVRLNVSIDVAVVNEAPVANGQSVSVNEDASIPVTLSATDANGDPLTYTVTVAPLHGTLTGTSPNLTYTPAANYHGSDSFSFTANDGSATSAPATVSITVNSQEEFNQWMAGYGLTAGSGADSDGDSISNAVEYVIGGNPANQNNVNLLPTISLVSADPDGNTVNADYLLFTYRRTDLAKNDPSAAISIQWASNLTGPWTGATGTPGVVTLVEDDAAGVGVDRVKVYIPRSLAPSGRLFARMGVALTTP